MAFDSAYQGKKVLITGHTGFKGSWLAIWLQKLGANVSGIALDPHTSEDIFLRANLCDRLTDIRGDITNLSHVREVFDEIRPDVVFHLAAQPIVRTSYDAPVETFVTNAIGTANILETIRLSEFPPKAAVLVTTDKVYQNVETIWGYREQDPLGGHDPYSASKACAEIIIDSYRKSFFQTKSGLLSPKIASVRSGNVIGGGDWQQDRLVPDCVRSLSTGEPITIRSPFAVRPWQHVLEPLGGYLLLGAKLLMNSEGQIDQAFDSAWNFGPMVEGAITVQQLVETIIGCWEAGEYRVQDEATEVKHEAKLLTLDITKALVQLGWHPVLDITDCVKLTIDWYKFALENASTDMLDFSQNQIEQYYSIAQEKNISWLF